MRLESVDVTFHHSLPADRHGPVREHATIVQFVFDARSGGWLTLFRDEPSQLNKDLPKARGTKNQSYLNWEGNFDEFDSLIWIHVGNDIGCRMTALRRQGSISDNMTLRRSSPVLLPRLPLLPSHLLTLRHVAFPQYAVHSFLSQADNKRLTRRRTYLAI